MDIRILLSFTLLVFVQSHDVTVGLNGDGKKIYDQTFEASPAIWRQAQNVTVNATKEEVISRVIVTDLRDDKDGEATIVEGGEGQKNVTVQLKSPTALRGYQFKVEVFAVPDKNAPDGTHAEKNLIYAPDAAHTEHKIPTEIGDEKATTNQKAAPKSQDPTHLTPLPPGRFSRENQPESTTEQFKKEDTSKLGVTQSSGINAKDGYKPLQAGLDNDNQNQQDNVEDGDKQNTATPIPSGLNSKATETQTKDVFEQTQEKDDEENLPEMINGQSMYPNVQPTSNGQLIRTVRDTEDIENKEVSTSAPGKNIYTTNLPNLESSTKDPKQIKAGLEASSEQKTNAAVKNLEFSTNKDDTPNIHRIPLGRSHGSSNNDWQTKQSSLPSDDDKADVNFEDNKNFFSNLGQLSNRQLTEGVKNLESTSKASNNQERTSRETKNSTTEPNDILKNSEDKIGIVENDESSNTKSTPKNYQTQDPNNKESANKTPIPYIPLPQQGPYDFASTIAPENTQNEKWNSTENYNGEHKLISKVNGEVKKPVISIE